MPPSSSPAALAPAQPRNVKPAEKRPSRQLRSGSRHPSRPSVQSRRRVQQRQRIRRLQPLQKTKMGSDSSVRVRPTALLESNAATNACYYRSDAGFSVPHVGRTPVTGAPLLATCRQSPYFLEKNIRPSFAAYPPRSPARRTLAHDARTTRKCEKPHATTAGTNLDAIGRKSHPPASHHSSG